LSNQDSPPAKPLGNTGSAVILPQDRGKPALLLANQHHRVSPRQENRCRIEDIIKAQLNPAFTLRNDYNLL
jgi:hypothetical protein